MTEQAVPDNPCVRAEQWLPDYWQDELGPAERAWLVQHLQSCAACAELTGLWQDLGELHKAEPDARQKRRFETMLAAQGAVPQRLPRALGWGQWLRPLPLGLGFALLFAGLGGGWWLRGLGDPAHGSEVAALRAEVRDTKELVVLSMLQQQSANDRLAGVSYSNGLGALDPQITQALLHSLRYDPSPDVRLAALDALQRANTGGKPPSAATRGLVEAFQYQESPLVQIALVDSFVERRAPEARQLLQKVSNDPNYTAEVRERAAWGLAHWN
jgi:HEAT repeats/Putative zinc-finger